MPHQNEAVVRTSHCLPVRSRISCTGLHDGYERVGRKMNRSLAMAWSSSREEHVISSAHLYPRGLCTPLVCLHNCYTHMRWRNSGGGKRAHQQDPTTYSSFHSNRTTTGTILRWTCSPMSSSRRRDTPSHARSLARLLRSTRPRPQPLPAMRSDSHAQRCNTQSPQRPPPTRHRYWIFIAVISSF
jgi:hypothetical protein